MKRFINTKTNPRQQNTNIFPYMDSQHQYYAELQVQKYLNSLASSGIVGTVYAPLTTGQECTCNPNNSLLDEDGDLTESGFDHIHKLATAKESVFSYSDFELGYDDPEKTTDTENNVSDRFNQLNGFVPYDSSLCGVCYGVGYVGGYTVSNGHRYVLDTQAEGRTDFKLNTDRQPHYYTGGSYIKYEVTLPKWDGQTIKISRLWNDLELIPTNLYNVTLPELGQLGTILIETTQEFTHFEIQFTTKPCFIDIPQLESKLDPTMMGNDLQTTMYIDPRVNVINYGVIRESKYNRAWQITQTKPHFDNNILVFWEVETRLISQQEIYNFLAR